MNIDRITRQTFEYATPISFHKKPQHCIAIYLDHDENDVLTPQSVLQATPKLFEPKHFLSAISPRTFTAQEDGIYSNAELNNFWTRVFFAKQPDATLKFSEEAVSFYFLAHSIKHSTDFYSNSNRKRFGLVCMITY